MASEIVAPGRLGRGCLVITGNTLILRLGKVRRETCLLCRCDWQLKMTSGWGREWRRVKAMKTTSFVIQRGISLGGSQVVALSLHRILLCRSDHDQGDVDLFIHLFIHACQYSNLAQARRGPEWAGDAEEVNGKVSFMYVSFPSVRTARRD